MKSMYSRRTMLQTAGAAALAMPLPARLSPMTSAPDQPRFEGQDTQKICLEAGLALGGSDAEATAGAGRIRQVGVNSVISGGGRIPWEEPRLRETMERLKANGL